MKYIRKPYFKEYLLLYFHTFTSRIMEKNTFFQSSMGQGGERGDKFIFFMMRIMVKKDK